jgi:uncharacterized protein YbjT (DUF2867 family)
MTTTTSKLPATTSKPRHRNWLHRGLIMGLILLICCATATPAGADVLIFGGTRGAGLETARLLSESGEAVTVMVRKSSDLTALNALKVNTVVGDAMEPATLAAAFESGDYDAVVSTLSGNPREGFAADGTGNINAIDATKAADVQRFILISSIGVGDSAAAMPPKALEALADALAGKGKAEQHLQESGLIYTVIRPGVLTNKPANGKGYLTEDPSLIGVISRAELARLTVESLGDKETYGKILSAIEAR